MKDRGRIGENYGDGIEPDLVPFNGGAVHISSRGAHDVFLLFLIDRAVGTAELGRCPRLHLDKHDQLALPGNDIDLRIGSWFVVACNYREAIFLEIAMREVFAATPNGGAFRQRLPLPLLPGGIA